MQNLHLVGFTTDHRGLIFSARKGAKSGSFRVDLDEALLAAIEENKAWLAEQADSDKGALVIDKASIGALRPQSALTVREVQARLRRGQLAAAIAGAAGVDLAWVQRFAGPVEAELGQMVKTARRAYLSKQRLGESALPMGEAVLQNLADRGVRLGPMEYESAWRAAQIVDGRWQLWFRYKSRGRTHEVTWEYDAHTNSLTTRDRLAAQLAHRPGPPRPEARASTNRRGRGRGAARTPVVDADEPVVTSSKATKRLTAARKAALAQLAADAHKAGRRNAAAVKRLAKPKPKATPAPAPAPKKAAPKKAAPKKAAPRKAAPKPKPRPKAKAARRATEPAATRPVTLVIPPKARPPKAVPPPPPAPPPKPSPTPVGRRRRRQFASDDRPPPAKAAGTKRSRAPRHAVKSKAPAADGDIVGMWDAMRRKARESSVPEPAADRPRLSMDTRNSDNVVPPSTSAGNAPVFRTDLTKPASSRASAAGTPPAAPRTSAQNPRPPGRTRPLRGR